MILLDSNIIIYLHDPKHGEMILHYIADERIATCNVVVSEVLGFRGLEKTDTEYFGRLFATASNYVFDAKVTNIVIELRRSYAIQLPDAIIAATAIANNLILWTHNTDDFEKITSLRVFDPIIS